MTRIVFMGVPDFSVPALEAIHAQPGFDIVGVYTQPDRPVGRGLKVASPPVKQKALELGLSIYQPEKLTAPGEFERLTELKPDAIVVVAYGQILKTNVLRLPKLGCVNIHSSLLPRWRGAAPIQRAILSGDTETGITTMYMVEKLDAGDILLTSRTPINPDDTAQTVHDRLARIGGALIVETLKGLEQGALKGVPQDLSQVTYAEKLTKEMEWLDPKNPAEVLDRQIRALNPWPGTSIRLAATGERLKIKKAKLRANIDGPQGKIFEKAGMTLIGTPHGAIELLTVQWDGKGAVDAGGFLNGLRGRGQTLPLELSSVAQ